MPISLQVKETELLVEIDGKRELVQVVQNRRYPFKTAGSSTPTYEAAVAQLRKERQADEARRVRQEALKKTAGDPLPAYNLRGERVRVRGLRANSTGVLVTTSRGEKETVERRTLLRDLDPEELATYRALLQRRHDAREAVADVPTFGEIIRALDLEVVARYRLAEHDFEAWVGDTVVRSYNLYDLETAVAGVVVSETYPYCVGRDEPFAVSLTAEAELKLSSWVPVFTSREAAVHHSALLVARSYAETELLAFQEARQFDFSALAD